jgi:hypothetical protein
MQTFAIDFHLLPCVLVLQELILTILNNDDCLLDLRNDNRKLIDEEPIDEFTWNIVGLKFLICIEEDIALVIMAEVEDEALVDEIVCLLGCVDAQILDSSLHEEIFLDD